MRALCCVVLFAVAGCGGPEKEKPKDHTVQEARTADAPPGCEDAVRTAAKRVPPLAEPDELAEAVAACIKEPWSAETRRCVVAVKDEPDLVACMMRHEQKSGARTLQVTGIEPDRGDINGDTYVIIKGNRFLADGPRHAKVYFGSQQNMRQGTVVRFASDKQLIVRTPGGKAGEVADVLVVFEPGGQLRLPGAFTYVEKTSGPMDLE